MFFGDFFWFLGGFWCLFGLFFRGLDFLCKNGAKLACSGVFWVLFGVVSGVFSESFSERAHVPIYFSEDRTFAACYIAFGE